MPKSAADLEGELRQRQERSVETLRKQQPKYFLLTPLVFAPVLPLISIAFKKQPRIRTGLFSATIGIALLHGFALMAGAYE